MRTLFLVVVLAGLAACGGGGGTPDAPADPGAGPDVTPLDLGPGDPGTDLEENGGRDLPEDRVEPGDVAGDLGGADDGEEVLEVLDAGELPGEDLPPDSGADTCEGPGCVPCPEDPRICIEVVRDPVTEECEPRLKEGFCLVLDTCYFLFQPSPDNGCLFCIPDRDPGAFLPREGLPCDDGDPCTSGDACGPDGTCLGGGLTDCNDDNPCTNDSCRRFVGCVQENYDSTCDDRNECTYLDRCQDRVCRGIPKTCNDNNPCTRDSCDPVLGCLFVPTTDPCNDGNACTENDRCQDGACAGTPKDCDDHDPCTADSCIDGPGGGCVHLPRGGQSCDDGDACTTGDFCSRPDPLGPRVCVGYPRVCGDGNPCTDESCDKDLGCVYQFNTEACPDDGDACTVDERCREGACRGVPRDCDDGNPCTIDSCDSLRGCQHVPTLGACEDGDLCTIGETCATGTCKVPDPSSPVYRRNCDDGNPCTLDECRPDRGCVYQPLSGICPDLDPCSETGQGFCIEGQCVGARKNCEDGNPCTVDSCDAAGNCRHQVQAGLACEDGDLCTSGETCDAQGQCRGGTTRDCNDQNVCTIDECRPGFGCVYTPTPGPCDDRNACTVNDQCSVGLCKGTPRICEDSNYCTDNTCDPAVGCVFVPNDLPCDDQNPCTEDDRCVAGGCRGVSLFTDPSLKAGRISIGVNGNPGQGVNVDGKETTCAPKGNCVQGIDNAFGTLSWLFNPEITKANADGSLAMLLEPEGTVRAGVVFPMRFYWGERIAPSACDPTAAGCNYGVSQGFLQGVCDPVYGFDNAVVTGNRLAAGGQGSAYTLPFYLIFGAKRLPLQLRWATLSATVAITDGVITSGTGALGGVVPRQEIRDAVAALQPEDFPPPYSRDIVLQYVDLYLTPDMDLDGDGTKESVSMGWPVTLVTGHIIGPLF